VLVARPACSATNVPVDWADAFATYARDPFHNRRTLLALRGHVAPDVSALYVLALGDAQLRAMRFAQAEETFARVVSMQQDGPWTQWARVGAGWAALARDERDLARSRFTTVAAGDDETAALGEFVLALLDAADGRDGVQEHFDRVAANPTAGPTIRRAGRLGDALARYWARDYAAAVRAFDAAASDPDAGELRDEALYGAAWTRVRAGDKTAARDSLEELAREPRRGRASHSLVDLEPQGLLRAALRRYRRGPLLRPEDQAVQLLDTNGVVLARAALRRLARDEGRDAPLVAVDPVAVWRDHTFHPDDHEPMRLVARPGRRDGSSMHPPASPGPRSWLEPLPALALLGFGALMFSLRQFTGGRRSR
jgi:tetratricopeptide (TPR) repeat protein